MAKAWSIVGISADTPLGLCARRVLDTRFREMMSYLEGTIAGEDIEMLHSMRVSTRRLRSAMRNFKDCFAPEPFRLHARQIKEIADTLGVVRDLDVRIAWLEARLAETPEIEHAGVRQLIGEARRARILAREPMIELLESLDRGNYGTRFLEFVWAEVDEDG